MQTRQMKTFCKNCSFGRRNLHLVVVHEGIATARLTLFFPIQPCQVNGHQPRTKFTSNKFWSFCNTWNATCWGTSLKQSSVGSRMVFGDPKFHFPTSRRKPQQQLARRTMIRVTETTKEILFIRAFRMHVRIRHWSHSYPEKESPICAVNAQKVFIVMRSHHEIQWSCIHECGQMFT